MAGGARPGAWRHDAEVLTKCDAETRRSPSARASPRSSAVRSSGKNAAFRAFAKSEHLRIREMAVGGLGQHRELGDAAATILAEALTSKKAGPRGHRRRRHQPATRSGRWSSPRARSALRSIRAPSAHRRSRAGALARGVEGARHRARRKVAGGSLRDAHRADRGCGQRAPSAGEGRGGGACNDANVVMRERAQKALRTLGENIGPCDAPDREAPRRRRRSERRVACAPRRSSLRRRRRRPAHVHARAGALAVTVTRLAALARSGFYKGIVVHRVAPGFVVQFGDPEGDGYGGSGTSLRCETSPVPFALLDIGMALAGRDTGSSQVFVTLSRTPHLDGEYTRIGRAEGAWSARPRRSHHRRPHRRSPTANWMSLLIDATASAIRAVQPLLSHAPARSSSRWPSSPSCAGTHNPNPIQVQISKSLALVECQVNFYSVSETSTQRRALRR